MTALRALSLAALAVVSGCALHARSDRQVPESAILSNAWLRPAAQTGPLTVSDGGRRLDRRCGDRLAIDGVEIATLRLREKIVLYLPWGDHILTTRAAPAVAAGSAAMCMGAPADALVSVEPGRPASYRVMHGRDGDTRILPGSL